MTKISINEQRIFFNLKENQYKRDTITAPPKHVRDELDFIIKKIGWNKNQSIIDFGSGTGRITIDLLKHGYRVLAVDISRESLNALKLTAKENRVDKDLNTSTEIPYNFKVEYIVGADILHHISLAESFDNIYQHLKKTEE